MEDSNMNTNEVLNKLIAEIERLQKRANHYEEISLTDGERSYWSGEDGALELLTTFITSLRQEQENVAERFARIVRGNLIGINKEVQQKFEQLYFEVTGHKMYGGFKDQPYTKEKEK